MTNIELDHVRAAELALEHLKALGHRRIAMIRGPAYSIDSDVRWRTIRDTARKLGIPIEARLAVQLTEYDLTPGPGYRATKTLLDSGRPFTALFAFNDVTAIGAIQALNDAGLDVPRDVAVVGFDDIPGAMYHRPGSPPSASRCAAWARPRRGRCSASSSVPTMAMAARRSSGRRQRPS